jgi:hypothetical protein
LYRVWDFRRKQKDACGEKDDYFLLVDFLFALGLILFIKLFHPSDF